jgi:hypothetical protein
LSIEPPLPAAAGEQDHRQVRPLRLLGQHPLELVQRRWVEDLLGDHHRTQVPLPHRLEQRLRRCAPIGIDAGLAQEGNRQPRVARTRAEDENALAIRRLFGRHLFAPEARQR